MHALNLLFGLLAVLGLILFGIGRWMMIAAGGELGLMWKLALRCLPFADLLFLSRYWDTAKNGAFTSLIGLSLLLPWAGQEMYAKNHPDGLPPLGLDMDAKSGIYNSMKMHHQYCIEAKERKFTQLNARMSGWYQSLQSRRTAVKSASAEELAAFNEETAAYRALHEVTKVEAAELKALRAQPFGFADFKDADFLAWRERAEKSAAVVGAISKHSVFARR